MWYHKEEKNTVGILLEYGIAHGDELLTLKYGEYEEYVCKFLTSYESDNIADVENSGAVYNEFIVVAYSVVATVVPGEHFVQGDGASKSHIWTCPAWSQIHAGGLSIPVCWLAVVMGRRLDDNLRVHIFEARNRLFNIPTFCRR